MKGGKRIEAGYFVGAICFNEAALHEGRKIWAISLF